MLSAAANLLERRAAGPPAGRLADGDDEGRAVRRLRRWAGQPPFDRTPWWERRLTGAGLTGAALLDLLAEPAAGLDARLRPRPGWLTELEAAYRCDPAPGPADPADPPFAWLAGPLLARARRRLHDELVALAGGAAPFEPAALLSSLYAGLPRLVERIVTRTLALELNVARVLGTLPGATPAARFDAFCAGLHGPQRQRLIDTYPVLGRLLTTVVTNWARASARFAARLVADWPRLAAAFDVDVPITGVITGLGDPHRGGQSVVAVVCGEQARFVYKPRPLAAERHVGGFVDWLAERGLSTSPRLPTCLDRGEYGWAEYVEPRPCADDAELSRFYRRQGALLAVLYLVRGGDLGAENLIAAGDHPVLIDLEAVCQPELTTELGDAPAAERAAIAAVAESVLRVGLLPFRAWNTAAGASADLSGLGGAGGQLSPIALPEVTGAGTDRLRLRLRHRELEPAANRPVGADTPLRLLDHADDLVDGFTEVYRLCQANRRDLLAADGPLAAFEGDPVRVIVRPTAEYALLRDSGQHPDALRDGLDAERHLDRLWLGVARRPALAACVEAERAALWRQDIPVFTAQTDECVLRSDSGTPIPGLVRRTGIECVRAVARRLGPDDLARQQWLIRTSLATAAMDARGLEFAGYPLPPTRTPAGPDRLLAGADAIGRHLAAIAYREAGGAQWLGVISNRGTDFSLGPLGPDLCTGLSGLALFLGFLGELTGEPAHTSLARAALAVARSQVERRAMAKVGGAAGLGGICYAYLQLGVLWDDGELLDRAVGLAELAGAWAADDEQFDLTGGCAGSIAALAALHPVRPAGPVTDAVRACAERLLDTREPGTAWLPRPMRDAGAADTPLAGLAHGAAGIAWPLLTAAALCGEPRYHDAAVAAIGYERSLFVPEAGTWQDRRTGRRAGAPFTLSAWCHGAAGIGLARVAGLPYLADDATRAEIHAAVRHTERVGFGTNHSLCHGDVGNLELLLLAGEALGVPAWVADANGRMGAIMDSIDDLGRISGMPHGVETPGLLQGLAGTGYGMLRMAHPRLVPSVLTLAPPPVR